MSGGLMRGTVLGLILCLLPAGYSHSQTSVDPGMLFLEAFGSSCGSRGVFTQRALSDTEVLVRIVETIKNDRNCQGLTPIFSDLISLSAQLEFFKNGFKGERREEIEDQIDRLSYALALETDTLVKASLAAEIAELKLEALRLPYQDDEDIRHSRALATEQFAVYIQTIGQIYPDQALCFENHKTLPIQMAGQILSIAGGLFDPTINAALTVGGNLISFFVDMFRKFRFIKRLKDYRKTTMQAGLTCAAESLEQIVCDIEDRRDLIAAINEYRDRKEIPEAWMGYELITREFPTFLRFLQLVEAGSPAGSRVQGDQKGSVRRQEGNFYAVIEEVEGEFGQYQLEAPNLSSEALIKDRIRRMVNAIRGHIFESSIFVNAIPNQDRTRASLWLRLGDPNPQDVTADGDPKPVYQILSELNSETSEKFTTQDAVFRQQVNEIRTNWNAIREAAEQLLEVERQVNIIADAERAIGAWTIRRNQAFTPEVVAEKFVDYFKKLEVTWSANPGWFNSPQSHEQDLRFLRNTRQMFEETIRVMRAPADQLVDPFHDPNSDEPMVVTEEELPMVKAKLIFDAMVLKEKQTVIIDRVNDIVLKDLQKRIQAGLLEDRDSLDVIIRLGGEDLIGSLTPGVTERTVQLSEDLSEAAPIALDNLAFFFKHYRKAMVASIEHLKDMAELYQEGPTGDYTRKVAKLCILNYNDAAILEHDDLIDECEGVLWGMDHEGRFVTDHFGQNILAAFSEKELQNTKPLDRLCKFRRQQNRRELYEDILRNRPDRFYDEILRNQNRERASAPAPYVLRQHLVANGPFGTEKLEASHYENSGWYYDTSVDEWRRR